MENNTTIEIPNEPIKKPISWQKIAVIAAAALLVGGLGTAVTLEVINHNNNQNQNTAEAVKVSNEQDQTAEDYFANVAQYTLELKDGENKITEPGVYTVTGSTSNGYIHINTGNNKVKLILSNITIKNSSGPAIYVESNGNIHIETVGENILDASPADEDLDAAIYSKADLIFKGNGVLNISSTVDGIHSTDDVKIKSGTINISAGDDGIKGKDSVAIQDGDVTVTKSNEAIESTGVYIIGGNINVTASDDGINAAADECSSTVMSPTGNANITVCKIVISGGTIKVNADGDGLDANGSIYLSGGTVYVDGPSNFSNGALDYDGVFEITGGQIIATGMSGMALNASSATQGSALINLSQTYPADSVIMIGNVVYIPTKSFNSIMVSSNSLEKGQSYELKINNQTVQTVEFTDYLVGSGSSSMQEPSAQGHAQAQGTQGGQPNQGGTPPDAQNR